MTKKDEVCEDQDLEELLIEQGKRYKKLNYLADGLDVSYQLLTYWLEGLGIAKEDFYRKKVCKRPCKLIQVEGNYRYKFIKLLGSRCRCTVGFQHVVANITDDDLKDLCKKKGFILKTIVDNDTYNVKI